MGNEILGKRPSNFFKGFNEAQVQYVKDKFDILKDDKGMMSKTKFQEIYHCPEAIAAKAIKFIDFTENGQVDEYEFLCGVAALCNAEFNRLTDMLFQILTDRKEKLNEVSL
jgi:Ca2+-binding EF-hand superfamily protein